MTLPTQLPHFYIPRIHPKEIAKEVLNYLNFVLLLSLYLSYKFINKIIKKVLPTNFQGQCYNFTGQIFYGLQSKLSGKKATSIQRIELMEIALRNMRTKKIRTFVTIGGMAIGIGIIVFLVSIGYGLQQLVIGRVARLEEMRQTVVSPQTGGKVKIDDKALANLKSIKNVTSVQPLISLVGRVNFQNSVTDMAVYGVTTNYLDQSAIKTIRGKIFDSNNLVSQIDNSNSPQSIQDGEVAGTASPLIINDGEKIGEIEFKSSKNWIRVRSLPNSSGNIVGYTRLPENVKGTEVWGSSYPDNENGQAGTDSKGKKQGKWINASVPLWEKKSCSTQSPDCTDGQFTLIKENNQQLKISGYFAEINLEIAKANQTTQVLGISSEDMEANVLAAIDVANSSASGSNYSEFIDLATASAVANLEPTKVVPLGSKSLKQAVVNLAMLKVLGINESEAINKKFKVTFVVVGDLLNNTSEKVQSEQAEYTIVGIVPDNKSPFFYVPFIDLRGLGIVNYSQVKLAVKNPDDLTMARKQVEALGYATNSVADTVNQINSLFGTIRTILTLLGMVALGVAALGMFNTLTVSLLERTREVGLMKAMGMRSDEVKQLFLTESMMMGFFGGVCELLAGTLLGKLISLILSVFTLSKGQGFINITSLPFSFTLTIMTLSFLVGLFTGAYPANRATKISALDALRYE